MTTAPIFNSAATEPARREQASIAEGHAQILRKLGRVGYVKCFGKNPDPKLIVKVYGVPKAPARTAAPARKAYAPPAAPRQLTRHCYTTRGIFA